jgi:hypothetical protein
MKRIFIVETAMPDSNGDIVLLDGVRIPKEVAVTHNFSADEQIGVATVKKEGDKLVAIADIDDKHLDLYPAIGFSVVKYRTIDTGKVYEEVDLQWIGLCEKQNLNPDIKTIREQTKDQ